MRSVNYKWAQQWRRAALKALSLPDASQIRIKFEVHTLHDWCLEEAVHTVGLVKLLNSGWGCRFVALLSC